MHEIVNPKQIRLFDPFDNVLTEKTRKRLLDGWATLLAFFNYVNILLDETKHS